MRLVVWVDGASHEVDEVTLGPYVWTARSHGCVGGGLTLTGALETLRNELVLHFEKLRREGQEREGALVADYARGCSGFLAGADGFKGRTLPDVGR